MTEELEKLLARAREHKMSPQEAYEQRVSFIWGQLGEDDKRSIDDIKAMLAERGIIEPMPPRAMCPNGCGRGVEAKLSPWGYERFRCLICDARWLP